ncbi:hypothetical protein V7S43_007629 [Phytophthora oleae]|uniref:Uncharacterized protein n=1 Tax=Phytophthora oleae TaxID=2107226 RepID=A0ABD3FKW0_9STRA
MQRLDEKTVIYYYTLESEGSEVRARAFILAMLADLSAMTHFNVGSVQRTLPHG